MTQQKKQELLQRGVLAPKRSNWEDEESDEEVVEEKDKNKEEIDNQPRKNRVVVEHEEVTKKPRFIERQVQQPKKVYKDKGQSREEPTRTKHNPRQEPRQYQRRQQDNRKYDNNQNYKRNQQPRNQERNNYSDYSVQKVFNEHQQYKNLVNIGSKSVEQYTQIIAQLLKNFTFVKLRAEASRIGKAFLVAEAVCAKVKNLDRINIPLSEEYKEIWYPRREGLKKFIRFRKSPQIQIELSNGNLTTKHIGFQSYKTNVDNDYQRDRRRRTKKQQHQ